MKKIIFILLVATLGMVGRTVIAQDVVDRQALIDTTLNKLDKNVQKWFPRWRICEPDLQMQIYNTFLYQGVPEDSLDFGLVEVLAAPKPEDLDGPYQILAITCGSKTISGDVIDSWLPNLLIGYIAGEFHYIDPPGEDLRRGDPFFGKFDGDPYVREYCYTDIPSETPLSPSSASAIIDYLYPTNKNHVITASLFDVAVKIGESGFWLSMTNGLDDVGMPFWYAGQTAITLRRPLIENKFETKDRIPYLLNFKLGGAYRNSMGLDDDGIFGWVPQRVLNSGKSGYLVVGADFYLPVEGFTEAGISASASMPLQGVTNHSIDIEDYSYYNNTDANFMPQYGPPSGLEWGDPAYGAGAHVVPIIREAGKISLFYNWWLNKKNPDNYIRFDLGYSFCNVEEAGLYYTFDPNVPYYNEDGTPVEGTIDTSATKKFYLSPKSDKNFAGIDKYATDGFQDWIYLKAEYRHQQAFPFGVSAQISNGLFQGRVWVPLFGKWFYLEAKYSTPLHETRPYELENFYMISPVIRLTI